jgi:hypothetical protein
MSSRQFKKKYDYQGTIVPMVAKLINQCKGMEKDFRIVSEKMLTEDNSILPTRMTIVVQMDTGEYIRHFWG